MMEEKKTPFALNLLKLGLVLLAVAAVVAFVLGLVNLLTADRIANIQEENMKAAMQAVLPADSYTDLGVTADNIDAVYQAGGNGWVVQVTETGSQGEVTMMVGVNASYQCTGISITSSSETAGLGAIASQKSEKGEAFRAQFVGVTAPVAVTKNGGSIDAISGATITSNAVCRGVTAALEYCQQNAGVPAPAYVAAPQAAPAQAAPASGEAQASGEASAEPASAEPPMASVG